MTRPPCANRSPHDESGLSLVELLVATTLLIVIVTVGFVVTTTLVSGTTSTQRSGFLTGPAQNGMQVLRELFAGAVPAQTVTTPSGTQLYTNECAGGTSGQSFPTGQGPFVSASGTDVVLCAVRSGANTAYTYEVHFTGTGCASGGNGICTLAIDQEPPPTGSTPPPGSTPAPVSATRTVESIASVQCTPCISATGTLPFVFSTTPANPALMPAVTSPPQATVSTANVSSIQAVNITLVLATSTSRSVTTTTLTSQVSLPNALGGLL